MKGLLQTAKQRYHTGRRPPYGYKLKTIQVGNTTKKIWGIEPKEAQAVTRKHRTNSKNNFIFTFIIGQNRKPERKDF